MNGTDFLKLLKTAVGFLILAPALVGFFALYVFFYADESLINFLRNARKILTDLNQFKSLLPISALAISLVSLLIWREVRKKNIRFFGWTIVISSLLFLTFIFTIFNPTFKDACGIGGLPPVLSLEFINNVSDVGKIAPKPEIRGSLLKEEKIQCNLIVSDRSDVEIRQSLQKSMWLDSFVIVPFYVALFLLMSQLLALANKSWLKTRFFSRAKPKKDKKEDDKKENNKKEDDKFLNKLRDFLNVPIARVLALIAAICSILGGLGDCVENFFSHWLLGLPETELQSNAWLASTIWWASHIKFGLIFFAVIILSLVFWRSAFGQITKVNRYKLLRLISLTLLALILLMCGIGGIYSLVLHNYHYAEMAMNRAFLVAMYGAFLAPILAGVLFIWQHRDFLKDF